MENIPESLHPLPVHILVIGVVCWIFFIELTLEADRRLIFGKETWDVQETFHKPVTSISCHSLTVTDKLLFDKRPTR